MKTNTFKYLSTLLFIAVLLACSTKKDRFLNRNFQALNTEFNVLFNGDIALQEGITDLKMNYKDNFWEILPIERMQIIEETPLEKETPRNASFERAEQKAIKAIQKRSMLIGGTEKNPQIDEAHLLLGKARYYDQRFVPALEAFNYILYKYPNSDKIYEAKIWREKTNIRMENDAIAVQNLTKLLSEIQFKDQIFADANAILAQAYLNLEQQDEAIKCLKQATKFTKEDEEKARYRYILGQLFLENKLQDSAKVYFQKVIDMKRKSPRRYVMQSHARLAETFDHKTGDTIAFLEKFHKLIEDRENRPYLDVLHHQMALYYERQENQTRSIFHYNKSLKNKSYDQYMIASNYRNLAETYFDKAKYETAGKYFDSTLTVLKPRTREHYAIKKKRDNLDDVILYEGIARVNDSILNIAAMTDPGKIFYFETYIAQLKKDDEARAKKEKEMAKVAAVQKQIVAGKEDKLESATISRFNPNATSAPDLNNMPTAPALTGGSKFDFYNPTTLAFGKREFLRVWGNRPYKENWRWLSDVSNLSENEDEDLEDDSVAKGKEKIEDPRYNVDFYISQLPTEPKILDSLAKERNFAYYQLGLIYKEKFKEYHLAIPKLENLLQMEPEERLVLPSMYNLYKIYQIIGSPKEAQMRDQILRDFPESRYAQIISQTEAGILTAENDPEVIFANLYKMYSQNQLREALLASNEAIDLLTGEEIVPKIELLKATLIGKLDGLEAYKNALNFVALTYPNSTEGKEAESLMRIQIPKLENLNFDEGTPISWKIIYSANNLEDKNTQELLEKLTQFAKERTVEKLTISIDTYTQKENFIVIHGIKSEQNAKNIVAILRDYKEYQIKDKTTIISNDNYKVIQIKKNLEAYEASLKP